MKTSQKYYKILGGLLLALTLWTPTAAQAAPGLMTTARNTWKAQRRAGTLQRALRRNPNNRDLQHAFDKAQRRSRTMRGRLWSRVKSTVPAQLLAGALVDGPRHTIREVREHPGRAVGGLLLVGGAAAALETTGVDVHTVVTTAGALLTGHTVLRGLRQAATMHRQGASPRKVARKVGQGVVYPLASFGLLTAASSAVHHSLSGGHEAVEGASHASGEAAGHVASGSPSATTAAVGHGSHFTLGAASGAQRAQVTAMRASAAAADTHFAAESTVPVNLLLQLRKLKPGNLLAGATDRE